MLVLILILLGACGLFQLFAGVLQAIVALYYIVRYSFTDDRTVLPDDE